MSDHLTFQRTPSQFALLIAVPAEVTAWLVADSLPPEKMYIPFGASFIGVAWADAAIRQSRRINFGSVFIRRTTDDEFKPKSCETEQFMGSLSSPGSYLFN